MCLKFIKRLFQKPKSLELPTLSLDKVIEELEYDILIHEEYAGLVIQNPSKYPPDTYGSYDWQIRWIRVYESAIYYLRSSR